MQEKYHVIKINWFIDGIYGTDDKITKAKGDDIIIAYSLESELVNHCENLTEAWCQGGDGVNVLNYKELKLEKISDMTSRYWNFDNVDNFGCIDYELIKSYSIKEVEKDLVEDKLAKLAIIEGEFTY